eukprot:TRINITY_DN10691_c0_g1_i1.p1 TRINITY_DN10691_c0_g1~~TRINITY_DN10691_c0_g1_i1.p1  ORF type:complete len:230 (+),score=61.44 TRINITY_DN10691_c0_g1_i1:84-773(+)
MADGEKDLAFIRITLIGSTGCGKTSLATAFVNNAMPVNTQSTTDLSLFYTTVRIGGDGEDSGNFNVLCEIEDTFGSERKDCGRWDRILDLRWPMPEVQRTGKLQEKEYKDPVMKGVIRSLAFPFATYEAPLTVESMKMPLTKNRMAYFIVFDANNQKSYQEAMKIHQNMQEYWLKKDIKLKPVVLLVGNKIDEQGDDFEMVRVNQSLWALEYRQRTVLDGDLDGKCHVQ